MPLDSTPGAHALLTTTDDPVVKLAKAAIEIIQTHGWCQDVGVHQSGARCLLSAIAAAERELYPGEWSNAYELIQRLGFETGMAVAQWNDRPKRTVAQVIKRLRAVSTQSES